MSLQPNVSVDAVEEFQLRRWAREHYVSVECRDHDWHPLVLEEMSRKDAELAGTGSILGAGSRIVPLAPDANWMLHPAHAEMAKSAANSTPVILQVPELGV